MSQISLLMTMWRESKNYNYKQVLYA